MQNSTHWKCTESSCILARVHGEVWVLPTPSDVDLLPLHTAKSKCQESW